MNASRAFSQQMNDQVIAANLNVDRLTNQANNPAHFMPGSRAVAEALIDASLARAIELAPVGRLDDAMRALGEGLHTVQDRYAHYERIIIHTAISVLITAAHVVIVYAAVTLSRIDADKMRYKCPFAVAVVFLLVSLPMIVGVATPSVHDGNWYSTAYVVITYPTIYIVGGVVDKVTTALFQTPSLYRSKIVAITLAMVYLGFVSFIAGAIVDRRAGRC